jgi:hypothetical protein
MFCAIELPTLHSLNTVRLGQTASVSCSVDALSDSAGRYSTAKGLDLTKEFAGGQFIVHITRPNAQTKNYMDVTADDLLASYEFNPNGDLQDRWLWVQPSSNKSADEMFKLATMIRRVFTRAKLEPWLHSNVQVTVRTGAQNYAVTVQPLGGSEAEKVAFVSRNNGSIVAGEPIQGTRAMRFVPVH